jgi:hypothetical protein
MSIALCPTNPNYKYSYNVLDVMDHSDSVRLLAFGSISIDVTLSSLSFVRLTLCPASVILRIELQD